MHVLDGIDGLSHVEPRHTPVAAHLSVLCVVSGTSLSIAPRSRQVTGELHFMQAVPQVVAAHVLHLVVQRAVVLESVVQGHDAGVIQPMQRLKIANEKVKASAIDMRFKTTQVKLITTEQEMNLLSSPSEFRC